MDGDDKEGMLGDASCSSWHGFKLLMIICCTRELWNSPRFISLTPRERNRIEGGALLASLLQGMLLPLSPCTLCVEISAQSLRASGLIFFEGWGI